MSLRSFFRGALAAALLASSGAAAQAPVVGNQMLMSSGSFAGCSGNDVYTQVLLHFDGSNGSTSVVDSNPNNARVWVSSAALTTSNFKFGTAALNGGNLNYSSLPYTTNRNGITWGTQNFTIDFWYRPSSPTNGYALSWQSDTVSAAASSFQILLNPTNTVRVMVSNGSSFSIDYTTSGSLAYNQWTHVAVVRSGSSFTTYLNGTASGSATGSPTVPNPSYPINVGARQSSIDYGTNGLMDEYRLSMGIARWTTNFVPPTQAYCP